MKRARRDHPPTGPLADLRRRGTAPARGAVQPRATGAARTGAGRLAPAEHVARLGHAAGPAGEERGAPRRRPGAPDGGGERRAAHHPRRGVAARQLLPDRGTDPHGAAASARPLQPRTASPGRRPVGRAAAGLRHRPRDDLARGRPPGHGGSRRLRVGLPVGDAAHHRRALGDPHHAAARLAREPAPRGGPDRGRPHGPEPRRLLGRPDDGDRGEGPEEPHPVDCRHGAVRPANGRIVRRGVRPPPAGQERGPGAAAHVDRAAPVGGRPDDRAAGPVGEPAPGRRPGLDQQQHQQLAVPRGRRLARLRRDAKRRGTHPAGGSGRCLCPDGLRHPRSGTATSSRRRPG